MNSTFKDPCLAKNHLQNLNESSWEMGKGASYRSDPEKHKTKPWQAWICYCSLQKTLTLNYYYH